MSVASVLEGVLGPDLPIGVRAYDGSRLGPDEPPAVLVRSPAVFQRLLTAPGELGLGRAYVAGELDVEGDLYTALTILRARLPRIRLRPRAWADVIRLVAAGGLRRVPPPPEEARLRGRRHSKARDAAAIAHHYDVSNAFYRILLGPSMTYSCAVWPDAAATLEQAQAAKYELVCRKLGLRPGMRVLDVGCGWGGMAIHAATLHDVSVVGVTLSRRQCEWAQKAVADAGFADRVEIRRQDYRDVRDGPYDAISSIGMFEDVGLSQLRVYFDGLRRLLRPGCRLLNHGISRPPSKRSRFARGSFIDRYVFPDGELHEVGNVVSTMQRTGLEVRHVEGLREHYALTLRAWVRNRRRAGRTPSPKPDSPARGSDVCTWHPRRSTSRPDGPKSIRRWRCGRMAAVLVCHCDRASETRGPPSLSGVAPCPARMVPEEPNRSSRSRTELRGSFLPRGP